MTSKTTKAGLTAAIETTKVCVEHKRLTPEAKIAFLYMLLNEVTTANVKAIADATGLYHPAADAACINLKVNGAATYRNGILTLQN